MGMTTEPPRGSKPTTGSAGRAGSDKPARQRPGSTVPGAAANKARSGVHGVANRIGRAATSTTASGRSAAGGLATTAGTATDTAKGAVETAVGTATGTAKGAVTTVAATVSKSLLSGVGAAFALAVRKVMLLLRFLRQLALQLLEALRRLALRLLEAAIERLDREPEAIEDEAAEDQEPLDEEAAEAQVDRPERARQPGPRSRSEGQRPQRPIRPRREATTPQPDAQAPAARGAPMARRPERLGGRGPGTGRRRSE
jgi:hypothetical protein